MKDILKPAIVLFIITAVAAAILGAVQSITEPAILAQTKKTQAEAMQQVLPDAESFEEMNGLDFSTSAVPIVSVNKGLKGGEVCGYVVNVQPGGFGGIVDTMVGISLDGTLTGLKVLTHSETPGLGAKATDPSFYEQYTGKQPELEVIKAGNANDSQIMAITSATITSSAVTDGANAAFQWVQENLGGVQ